MRDGSKKEIAPLLHAPPGFSLLHLFFFVFPLYSLLNFPLNCIWTTATRQYFGAPVLARSFLPPPYFPFSLHCTGLIG